MTRLRRAHVPAISCNQSWWGWVEGSGVGNDVVPVAATAQVANKTIIFVLVACVALSCAFPTLRGAKALPASLAAGANMFVQ